MSVSARMKQYGAMRAIGMSTRQLVKMVTAEAATYSLVGSLAGCLIGLPIHKYLFEHMVTGRWGDPWNVPIISLILITGIVFMASFFAVQKPAKRLQNMSIVENINAQ